MELPVQLVVLITAVVGAGVTWLVVEGVKSLGHAFGWDLGKLAQALAAVVSAGVVAIVLGVANVLLGSVPPAYWPVVDAILKLLIVLFGAMGIHYRLKLAQSLKYGH